MLWLATRPDAVRTPTPKAVLDALPQFDRAKSRLKAEWHGNVPLERAVELRTRDVIFLPIEPAYDGVRDDPRYLKIVEAMGLHSPDAAPI